MEVEIILSAQKDWADNVLLGLTCRHPPQPKKHVVSPVFLSTEEDVCMSAQEACCQSSLSKH